MRKPCRHCGGITKSRVRRGLCWHCYKRPELRMAYLSESKFGAWADRSPPSHQPPPIEANGLARSEVRLMQMQELAARRQSLFNHAG